MSIHTGYVMTYKGMQIYLTSNKFHYNLFCKVKLWSFFYFCNSWKMAFYLLAFSNISGNQDLTSQVFSKATTGHSRNSAIQCSRGSSIWRSRDPPIEHSNNSVNEQFSKVTIQQTNDWYIYKSRNQHLTYLGSQSFKLSGNSSMQPFNYTSSNLANYIYMNFCS